MPRPNPAFRFVSRGSKGASLLTYGLVVGLISIVALTAVTTIGENTTSLFGTVGTQLGDVIADTGAAATPEEEDSISCGGVALSSLGPAQAGLLCSDGTFYVGQIPGSANEGANEHLFAAPCDVGMNSDGSGGCTGTRSILVWGPNFDTSLTNFVPDSDDGESGQDYSGRSSSQTLAALGSAYEAAQVCNNGYSDTNAIDPETGSSYATGAAGGWYLPAARELDMVWAATHASAAVGDDDPSWLNSSQPQSSGTVFAQTFPSEIFSNSCGPTTIGARTGFLCNFWSSTERSNGLAWNRSVANGTRNPQQKDINNNVVRCVRRAL